MTTAVDACRNLLGRSTMLDIFAWVVLHHCKVGFKWQPLWGSISLGLKACMHGGMEARWHGGMEQF